MEFFDQIKHFFEKEDKFLLVYLFGSRVSAKSGPISDYDFSILPTESLSSDDYYQLIHKLTEFLKGAKVDIVLLNEVPIELRYNVVATGRLIYRRNKAQQVEVEANTLSLYFDYLPVLRKQRKDLLKGGNYERRIQRSRETLRKTEELLKQLRSP